MSDDIVIALDVGGTGMKCALVRPDGTERWLLVRGEGTGTLALDMVSLFPRDTYRGRANGLRRDLAEKIAAQEK